MSKSLILNFVSVESVITRDTIIWHGSLTLGNGQLLLDHRHWTWIFSFFKYSIFLVNNLVNLVFKFGIHFLGDKILLTLAVRFYFIFHTFFYIFNLEIIKEIGMTNFTIVWWHDSLSMCWKQLKCFFFWFCKGIFIFEKI